MKEKMKVFNLTIPETLHSDFKSKCAQKKVSMVTVIKALMKHWMGGLDDIAKQTK